MFRSLLVNTATSALAYLVVSIVGLALVPLLVRHYGLAQFGLITLLRSWLPSGLLGPFDLGVSETATQTVSKARVDSDWTLAHQILTQLILMAATAGTALGALLCLAATMLTTAFHVDATDAATFTALLYWTGLSLPLLFLSLVFEGIVKGYENFAAMRGIEVATTFVHAGASVACVYGGADYAAVAAWFLAAQVFRAVVSIAAAVRLRGAWPMTRHFRNPEASRLALARARLMGTNKMLSTAQGQAPAVIIGWLMGPGSVAVYDVLVRLPRFAKTVCALLNSAVLPFAARLQANKDTENFRRLGEAGLAVTAAAVLPPLFAGAAFSEPLLRLWIGPQLSQHWPWLCMMFAVPAATSLVGFAAAALQVRESFVRRMNQLLGLSIGVQLVVSLATFPWLSERAFVLGQVLGTLVIFLPQMRIVERMQDLRPGYRAPIVGITLSGLAMTALAITTGLPSRVTTLSTLALSMAAATAILWAVPAAVWFRRAWAVRSDRAAFGTPGEDRADSGAGPAPARPLSYRPLGGLRVVLASIVFIYHLVEITPLHATTIAGFQYGPVSVFVFFVISGFVITESALAFYHGRPGAFLTNRLVRLYPPYLLAVVLTAAVGWSLPTNPFFATGWDAAPNLVSNAFALFPTVPLTDFLTGVRQRFDIVSIIWAVRVEFAFYAAVAASLALAAFMPNRSTRSVIARLACCGVLVAHVASLYVVQAQGRVGFYLSFAPHFVLGVIAAWTARGGVRKVDAIIGGCAFGLGVLQSGLYPSLSGQASAPAILHSTGSLASIALYVALLGIAARLANSRPSSHRLLQWDKKLGEFSYPIYLLHIPAMYAAYRLNGGTSYANMPVAVALAVAASWSTVKLTAAVIDPMRQRIRRHELPQI